MKPKVLSLLIPALLVAALRATPQTVPDWPQPYDVVWDSQSRSSGDSMPLPGHDLGVNVWVQDNDLLLLMGGPDCLDEDGMQVKFGLVRVRFTPVVFAKAFRQELRLAHGEIVVSGQTPEGKPVSVTLWCDASQPSLRMSVSAGEPVSARISYETWSRYEARHTPGGLQWMWRLAEDNARRQRDIKAQGMEAFAKSVPDPLSRRTMGGRIDAPGLVPDGTEAGTFNGMNTRVCAVKTASPVAALGVSITLRTAQDAAVGQWEQKLAAAAATKPDRNAAQAWWRQFWDRSRIVIRPGAKAGDRVWEAGRNYNLFRFMLAANRSGKMMTLFNGGLFACEGNPDKRNWDGCQFMGQNQMLVYWPMQRAGDFDLLRVGCDFYRDAVPARRLHAKKFWDVEGVTYPEPLSVFGLDAIGTTAEGRSHPKHLYYHYTSGMVFALMMLAHDSHTGLRTPGYTDAALGILSYYDQYYQGKLKKETGRPLDAGGKLVIYPSDACEPYHGCTNNLDVLAGLQALVRDLLATPPGVLDAKQRAFVLDLVKRIPEYKFEEKNGRKLYAAADKPPEWIFHNKNMDFPQMYICFPFSAVSLGRSDMDIVRNTWELGPVNATVQHQNQCWYQNAINLARMGDTRMAADHTLRKLLHPGRRFPSFYYTEYIGGGSFCHPPDHDHGGVAMTALQEMLMQTDGRRILLAPAWPADWDCEFKLHAPFQTTVEGRVADGKVVVTRVVPEARRKDIEIFEPRPLPKPPVSQGKPATASSVWHQAGYDPAKAVDGDDSTRWAVANQQFTGWLEVDLGNPAKISRAVIKEISWPGITRFTIEALGPDGQWTPATSGTTIGANLEITFPPVTAQKFRLKIDEAKVMPNIEEFQLY